MAWQYMKPIEKLYFQYCSTIGRKFDKKDLENESVKMEFIAWIIEMNKALNLYGDFMDYLGVDTTSGDNVEINKNNLDSLSSRGISVITPYVQGFKNKYDEERTAQIIVGDESGLMLYCPSVDSECSIPGYDWFTTHNPYEETDALALEYIASMGRNVCLGVFGNIFDKDFLEKLSYIQKKSESLSKCTGVSIETDSIGDVGMAIIKTEPKVLRRQRTS